MQLVERHIVKKNSDQNIDQLCFLSKNLYNYTNYILRQLMTDKLENIPEFTDLIKTFELNGKTHKTIDEYDLTSRLASVNQIDYKNLPGQTNQQVIKLLYKNWKSFFKSIKDYQKNPSNYLGRPKLPAYKEKIEGRNVIMFTNQNTSLKDGYIHFPKKSCLEPLKTNVESYQQVRISPQATCFIIEVVYNKKENINDLDKTKFIGIDLGINNFATIVDNKGSRPLIVKGEIIKSINQRYNKKLATLQSFIGDKGTSKRINHLTFRRNNKVYDYIHKASRLIVNYCLSNKVGTIVIGHNVGWKDEVNIGTVNNQKFVMIPHSIFIDKLRYKCMLEGIECIEVNEAHTSKCDSLALESVEHHETYLGNRIKRGLFKSSVGKFINSDVNGSINILRKVIGDDFMVEIVANMSCVEQPVTVNCCCKFH
jgi:putative transposase